MVARDDKNRRKTAPVWTRNLKFRFLVLEACIHLRIHQKMLKFLKNLFVYKIGESSKFMILETQKVSWDDSFLNLVKMNF